MRRFSCQVGVILIWPTISGTYLPKGPATDLDARAMLIEQHSPPEIVLHGLVTPEDVDRLFEM